MLLTLGQSYVGNDVTHLTLDRVRVFLQKSSYIYRSSYRVSNTAPRNAKPGSSTIAVHPANDNGELIEAHEQSLLNYTHLITRLDRNYKLIASNNTKDFTLHIIIIATGECV